MMKQIIQNYRSGRLELIDAPVPVCTSNTVLVKNMCSLVSIGTERSIIELGKKSLLGKAKARPDLVRRFKEKALKEGLLNTFKQALERLDNPTALGYSSAGIVVEVGNEIHNFSPGDTVACIGAGYALHAEYVRIPNNLLVKIPFGLSFEEASFGMLGIIALHGIRNAKITFGESVAVIGLGLLGLLTIQILKSYGCKVIGFDLDQSKINLARKLVLDSEFFFEENDFKEAVETMTNGYGIDAVIVTTATKSDKPIHLAVDIGRPKSRIVVVGVTDIHPDRNEMWQKEIEILVSKAGGPGTLDPLYEIKNIDYPFGEVRWTERRNLEEFLRLVSKKSIEVKSLISHRTQIFNSEQLYQNMLSGVDGPYVGVVLEYPQKSDSPNRSVTMLTSHSQTEDRISLGIIGAGLFGKSILLPQIKKVSQFQLHTLATSSSANAFHTAKKYHFLQATTDYKDILKNKDINAVAILTPHSQHAKMVIEALEAGKHVFVEKPLCVNEAELLQIKNVYTHSHSHLLVGYNRRFSPHLDFTMKFFQRRRDPMVIHYRVNAGFVGTDHWTHSIEEGGSRVIGEMCHFVDLFQYLTKSPPISLYAERVSGNNKTALNSDNISVIFKFLDGSIANLIYSDSGDRSLGREQLEIFCEGKSVLLSDYKRTIVFQNGKKNQYKTWGQESGYFQEFSYFRELLEKNITPRITPEEIFTSTAVVFAINKALQGGMPIHL